jgi:hypothetical protein
VPVPVLHRTAQRQHSWHRRVLQVCDQAEWHWWLVAWCHWEVRTFSRWGFNDGGIRRVQTSLNVHYDCTMVLMNMRRTKANNWQRVHSRSAPTNILGGAQQAAKILHQQASSAAHSQMYSTEMGEGAMQFHMSFW